MKTESCREWRDSLGAYALGHLPAEERAGAGGAPRGLPGVPRGGAAAGRRRALLPLADPEHFGPAPQPPRRARRAGRGADRRRAARAATPAPAALRPRLRRRGGGRDRGRAGDLVLAGGGGAAPQQQIQFTDAARRGRDQGDARTARLRHRDPHVRRGASAPAPSAGSSCAAATAGLPGRQLPLPLGRRLRGGAELGARPLAHAGDRRPRRQPRPSSPRSTRNPGGAGAGGAA